LYSPKWGIDIKKLTSSEIAEKHAEVIRLINTGGVYGGYDAILYLMGRGTADLLAKNIYVKARPLPAPGSSLTLSALPVKRAARDWDDDSRVTTASVIEVGRKKTRS
jgi:hypothetical protein